MRAEFLQAMQALCHEYDALFVLDEVQTGVGLTGTPWLYQQLGLEPDIVAFAKKVQLGGIMAGRRIDEVADNVFTARPAGSTRPGAAAWSTWSARGGSSRSSRPNGLFDHAAKLGDVFLSQLRDARRAARRAWCPTSAAAV